MRKFAITCCSIALLIQPCICFAEYESIYKQKTAQEYRDVAKSQGGKIVSSLSEHTKNALGSQMSHMNQYERTKYISKINAYYGTKYSESDFQGLGYSYANNMRLDVENKSRASVVQHNADLITKQGVFDSTTVDQKTYERMLRTQQAAKESGNLGIDYAKQMIDGRVANEAIRQFNSK
jgi:hypothetical protein